MHDVLDLNNDQRVTESDFENLAVKFLCGKGMGNFKSSNSYSQSSTYVSTHQQKAYTSTARNRLDVIRRLFKKYDSDGNGFLTQE